MNLPAFTEYTTHYDNRFIQHFKFQDLSDDQRFFTFSCIGYVYGDTCTITDIDFALINGDYDFVEVRGLQNILPLFRGFQAEDVLSKAMLEKYNDSFTYLKFKGASHDYS